MKNRFYILFVLVGLLGTFTVNEAYAQRVGGGHGGGGGHSGGGGGGFRSSGGSGRVYTAPRMSSPRVTAPVNRGYYHGGGRAYYGHGYYGRSWYRPYYRPYYNPFYPRLGLYVSTLPFGYFSLGAAFGPMYYFGGSYYQSTGDDRGYQVVEAPNGASVPDLPEGAQEIQVDGNTYYELNGTYYQETMTDNGRRYIVVGKNGKIGDKTVTITDDQGNNNPDNGAGNNNALLSQLPDNCRTVNINGQQYFLSPDGMYYQSVLNSDNTIAGYKVVGKMNADN